MTSFSIKNNIFQKFSQKFEIKKQSNVDYRKKNRIEKNYKIFTEYQDLTQLCLSGLHLPELLCSHFSPASRVPD